MRGWLGFFVPHFVTEDVAVHDMGDGVLQTTMAMDAFDPEEDEAPAYVIPVRAFSWLGFGWNVSPASSDLIPYEEWRQCRR